MTPEAVVALQGVAAAVDGARAEMAGLSTRWAEDMEAQRIRDEKRFKEIRSRENHRFQTVNRTLALIVAGTAIALLLLGFVVWQSHEDADNREARSVTATAQRRCADVVVSDVLGRLSILAVQPRYRENADGTPVRDEAGRLIPLTQDELLAQTEQLRRDVDASNRVLTRVGDVCYGPDGPDSTPLDGDPSR